MSVGVVIVVELIRCFLFDGGVVVVKLRDLSCGIEVVVFDLSPVVRVAVNLGDPSFGVGVACFC